MREAPGRIDGGHALARLAVRLHAIAEPVLRTQVRLGERLPDAFRRRRDVGDIDEGRFGVVFLPPPFLPPARSVERDVAGLEQRFQVRQDLRPAAGHRLDELAALAFQSRGGW